MKENKYADMPSNMLAIGLRSCLIPYGEFEDWDRLMPVDWVCVLDQAARDGGIEKIVASVEKSVLSAVSLQESPKAITIHYVFRSDRGNPSVWYSPYDLASENESRRALSRYVDAQKEELDESQLFAKVFFHESGTGGFFAFDKHGHPLVYTIDLVPPSAGVAS